jgi:DNA mismatch repair protein MutH
MTDLPGLLADASSPFDDLDEREILERALVFAGRPLSSLGALSEGKGAVGELVERALGLARSSAPEPDFKAAGVEVKTLPVDDGKVVESTWVCSASPASIVEETWPTSRVKAKLARVLFVPVEAKGDVGARRVGTAFLWSPADDEERTLRGDWEDLADLVAHGLGFAVTARRGRALQLRPKAKHARVVRTAVDVEGDAYELRPQGFYLRRAFTQHIVDTLFAPRSR